MNELVVFHLIDGDIIEFETDNFGVDVLPTLNKIAENGGVFEIPITDNSTEYIPYHAIVRIERKKITN